MSETATEALPAEYESLCIGIALYDPQTGEILDTNRRAEALLGYGRKHLRRMDIEEYTADTYCYSVSDFLARLRSATADSHQELRWRIKRENGALRWIQFHFAGFDAGELLQPFVLPFDRPPFPAELLVLIDLFECRGDVFGEDPCQRFGPCIERRDIRRPRKENPVFPQRHVYSAAEIRFGVVRVGIGPHVVYGGYVALFVRTPGDTVSRCERRGAVARSLGAVGQRNGDESAGALIVEVNPVGVQPENIAGGFRRDFGDLLPRLRRQKVLHGGIEGFELLLVLLSVRDVGKQA